MFFIFSPYSFFFFSFYLFFLISLFRLGNFYYYWGAIELMMLLFIGLRYTTFINSYSQLIMYFLIQAISSFSILVAYIYSLEFLMTIRVLLKLSMFPFFMWYLNIVYRFPNFIFWLARTLHKVPVMLMLKVFSLRLNLNVLWVSIVLTTLFRGLMILRVVDFRLVLVLSSVGNNSWLVLSQMTSLVVFLLFIVFYRLRLFFLISRFYSLSKPSLSLSFGSISPYKVSFWVLSLSGMPPFPLFYAKILVILNLLLSYNLNFLFFLFILFNSFMVIGYIQSLMKFFIYNYTSLSHYLIRY